jgi:triacylglycerol esterase/lipase EstA (alpha/beta hydrolase family)
MAPISHFMRPSGLPSFGLRSEVLWSNNPTGNALVFVHGFNGKAVGTWSSFPSLLPCESKLSGWDFFFFGYDGLHTEVKSSADDLGELLDAMTLSPKDVYLKSMALPHSKRVHPATYERIVLIGHSLGAIVCRRAMLDGYNQRTPKSWAATTQLFLFAPAHNGAKITELVDATFPFTAPLASALHLIGLFGVLRDLEAGSKALRNLRDDLDLIYQGGKAANLQALETVIARNDRIVDNLTYRPDWAPVPISGNQHTHTSLCKPNRAFIDPVSRLLARI